MKSADLWAIYTRKNPQFETTGATFTAAGLKKFFEQTYDQGHSQGLENGKALAGKVAPVKGEATDPYGIFREVFGDLSPFDK